MQKKNLHKSYYFLSILLFSILFIGCNGQKTKTKETPSLFVSIEPLRYFADSLVGETYKVKQFLPPNQSPENYEPTTKQIMQLTNSQLYFKVGFLKFEMAWEKQIKELAPHLQSFNTSVGLDLLSNDHSAIDPHTWMSIKGAKNISHIMYTVLCKNDTVHQKQFVENFARVYENIEQIENELYSILAHIKHRHFMIYHPALTYFAKEFDLVQHHIEIEGKEASPKQLKELINTSKKYDIRVIFVQPEFDKRQAEIIAKETGCVCIPINPLDYNWKNSMLQIAKSMRDHDN